MGLITFDPLSATSPQGIPQIDRTNPLAKGLVFCAYPVGKTFLDLVTGEYGTPTSAITNALKPKNAGFVGGIRESNAIEASAALDQVGWPASSQLRGGTAIQQGTILCLGGITEKVAIQQYLFGSSMNVDGSGMGLRISSGLTGPAGSILRSKSGTTAIGWSSSMLGTTPGLATHLFGYTYNANGANGKWLGARGYEEWTGGSTFGTANTNRRAFVFTDYNNASYSKKTTYVSLFCIWDIELSVGEYQALYDAPYAFIKRSYIQLPFAPAASGAPILSAADVFNITATTATPRVTVTF